MEEIWEKNGAQVPSDYPSFKLKQLMEIHTQGELIMLTDFANPYTELETAQKRSQWRIDPLEVLQNEPENGPVASFMVREFRRMNVTRTSPNWYINRHGKLAVNT